MNKKFIIASGVIIILVLVVVLYFLLSPGKPTVQVTSGTATLPLAGQNSAESNSTSTLATSASPTQVASRLVKISSSPTVPGEVVVDAKAVNASSSPTVSVMYIDQQSGNVFSYSQGAGTITRTSNRTIPGIQSAAWLPNGTAAVVRYLSGSDLSTINTYDLPTNGSSGFFLAQDLAGVGVSSTTILATASGVNGSVVSLERTDGSHSAQLFSTPLTEITVSFAGKNQYLAVTKPAGNIPGAAFLVSSSGNFSRIAGPLGGLSALPSPSGKWVLISASTGSSLQTEIINTKTGQSIALPLATLAEKCVWTADESALYCGVPTNLSSGALYPDDWYKGVAHFSDQIWRIDINGRYAQLALDLSNVAGTSIDVEAPAIDPNSSTLVFINKNDGSLWDYSL